MNAHVKAPGCRRESFPIVACRAGWLCWWRCCLSVLLRQRRRTLVAATTGTVTVVRLNVRSAPSMTGTVTDALPQNATVTILGKSEDGDWYQCPGDRLERGRLGFC